MTTSTRCCVPNCNKSRQDNTVLHLLPNPEKEPERFRTWLYAIGGEILAMDNKNIFRKRRVCHRHFESKYQGWNDRLTANAIPTLQLPGRKDIRMPKTKTIKATKQVMSAVLDENSSFLESPEATSEASVRDIQQIVQLNTASQLLHSSRKCLKDGRVKLYADAVESINSPEHVNSGDIMSSRGVSMHAHIITEKRETEISYSEAIQPHLRVAVTTIPPGQLSGENVNQLRMALRKLIFDQAAAPFTSIEESFTPAFQGQPDFSEGVLKLSCENDSTLLWLKEAITMQTILPGISLSVVQLCNNTHQVTASLFLPNEEDEDVELILQVLIKQNPWYNLEDWMLYSVQVQVGKGLFLRFGIPETELPKLQERQHRIAFSIGSVYIKYITTGD